MATAASRLETSIRQLRSSIQDAQNSTFKLAQDFQTQLERERKDAQSNLQAQLERERQEGARRLETLRRQLTEDSKRESQRLVQACTEACNRELNSRNEQLGRCRNEAAQVHGGIRRLQAELHDSAVARDSLRRDVARLEAQTDEHITRIQQLERENTQLQRSLRQAQRLLEPGEERGALMLTLPRQSSRRSLEAESP